MRILWWSNGPSVPSGYGVETALFAPLLQEAGHDVAIVAYYGQQGYPTLWNGIPVYSSGREDRSLDMLQGYCRMHQADLVVTLMDTWKLNSDLLAGLREDGWDVPIAAWTPVDCKPMGGPDLKAIQAADAIPVAMSRHGERMMRAADLDPLYVPHGVDTTAFRPPEDRRELRRQLGLDGRFVIGINAANQDSRRKGLPEQFRAFAAFRKGCPEALLQVHTVADNVAYGGLDLKAVAGNCGLDGTSLQFCDQDTYIAGMYGPEAMAGWYGCLDILSNCSYGEGFGIPLIEAQACGTPVVTTRAAAMTELAGPGWLVDGEPDWHWGHEANWVKPSVPDITHAFTQAAAQASQRRQAARDFAEGYDAKRVLDRYWLPALENIASRSPHPA